MKISKKQQVKIIKAKVEDLTDALENLNLELGILEQLFGATATQPVGDNCAFRNGDFLKITDNYLGKKGTIIEIKSTTRKVHDSRFL